MRLVIALLVSMICTSCVEPWKEIKREKVGSTFKKEESCDHYDYCYRPGHFTWEGKWVDGKWGFSYDCPGKHMVTYQRWKIYYKRPDVNAKTPETTYEFMTSDWDEELEATNCS